MLSSSLILRRFCGFSATATYSSSFNPAAKKKRLVFLVSPLVSAAVLVALFNASCAPDSLFEIAAIVTQPPSGRDRGRKVMPSPVAQHAFDRGFPFDLIFTPARAGEGPSIYTQACCLCTMVQLLFKEHCRMVQKKQEYR